MIQETPQSNSPLSEVSPTSLDDLFAKDPIKLTDAEVDTMVDYFRKKRSEFAQAEVKAQAEGKKRVAKPKVEKAAVASLDELGDLI